MTPDLIYEALSKHRPELQAERLADGFSFWLGPKQNGPDSNRVIRVRREHSSTTTSLKRAVTVRLAESAISEQPFIGNLPELLAIVDEEVALMFSCSSLRYRDHERLILFRAAICNCRVVPRGIQRWRPWSRQQTWLGRATRKPTTAFHGRFPPVSTFHSADLMWTLLPFDGSARQDDERPCWHFVVC